MIFKECSELNWKIKSLQCKIRRRNKNKKTDRISVKRCEDLSTKNKSRETRSFLKNSNKFLINFRLSNFGR